MMNKQSLMALLAVLLAACQTNPPQRMPEGTAQGRPVIRNQQWICRGNDQQQWLCRQLTAGSSTLYRTPAAPAPPVSPRPAPPDKPATLPPADNPPSQAATTLDYPDHYVVVQLLAARQASTLAQFHSRHPELPVQQLTLIRQGKPLYVLILGVYADQQEAQNAVNAISPALANTPWLRPLGPLKRRLLKP